MRIPANGGTPESLTKPDGAAQGSAHDLRKCFPEAGYSFHHLGKAPGSWVLSLIHTAGRWSCRSGGWRDDV